MTDITTASTEGRKKSQSETRKPKRLRYLWAIIMPIGLPIILFGYATIFILPSAGCPKAHQYVGPNLAWRQFFWLGFNRWFANYAVGQFDQDPDQELLMLNWDKPAVILNVDGTRKRTGLRLPGSTLGYASWDYNADGIDDIVFTGGDDPGSKVLDLDGVRLANIASVLINPEYSMCDLGKYHSVGRLGKDSSTQLVFPGSPGIGRGICSYKQNSPNAKTIIEQGNFEQVAVLDIDHDGVDEILAQVAGQGDEQTWLAVYSGKVRDQYKLPKPWKFGNFAIIDSAGDIGYFYKPHSFVNLTTKQKVHLQYPLSASKGGWSWGIQRYCLASGDFLSMGKPQIAIAFGDLMRSAILMFNADGECLYYREMGCNINNLVSLKAGGRDCLVAFCAYKAFIYP